MFNTENFKGTEKFKKQFKKYPIILLFREKHY